MRPAGGAEDAAADSAAAAALVCVARAILNTDNFIVPANSSPPRRGRQMNDRQKQAEMAALQAREITRR